MPILPSPLLTLLNQKKRSVGVLQQVKGVFTNFEIFIIHLC